MGEISKKSLGKEDEVVWTLKKGALCREEGDRNESIMEE